MLLAPARCRLGKVPGSPGVRGRDDPEPRPHPAPPLSRPETPVHSLGQREAPCRVSFPQIHFVMFSNVLFDQWPVWSQLIGIFVPVCCTEFNSGHTTKGADGGLRVLSITAAEDSYFVMCDALKIAFIRVLSPERQGLKLT